MKTFLATVVLLSVTSISIAHGRIYFGGGRQNGSAAAAAAAAAVAGEGEKTGGDGDGAGQWSSSSSSLAFVFDTTGSMYDDLVQVIEGAAKILATTLAMRSKPLHNYILVPFHDPEVGPVTVTTDPEKFQQDLRDLYVQGGGDCPEMSITGIKQALQEALPYSFVYVFTDARAKDYNLTDEVLGLIQHKQSQVIFVMTGDCGNVSHPGFKAYERIASTSSGQVFLLKKSQVNKILDFVRVAVQSRKVNLLAIDFNRTSAGGGEGGGGGGGEESTYDLPVDTKLQEFTISVSGKNPSITIIDPYGNVLTPDNGLSTLLDLKNALIVNVKHPKPGVWRLRFGADGQSTVRVTGLSSLDFVHGFSRNSTLHLSETTSRPIKGIPTFVVVNATDLDGPGRLTKVELVDLYGDLLMEIPVHRDSTRPALYNTSSFQPPSDFFYLKIVGVDEEGHLFQRTTATAISGTEPQVAEVHLSPLTRGYYDQTALITCQVISSIPFELRWFYGEEQLGTSLFYSESANVTWAIPDASSSIEGLYTCGVWNVAGESSASTYLDVTDAPPSVHRPENVSVIPGDDAVFRCSAVSSVDFNITWLRHPEDEPGDLEYRLSNFRNGTAVIRSVRDEDKGRYLCRATNEGGSRDEVAWLQVQSEPKVLLESESMTFMVGAEVRLLCRTFGYPLPVTVWTRGGQLVERSERIDVDDGTGELTIAEAEKDDEGPWTCVAENTMGRSNASIALQRIAPPTISVLNRTVLVSVGDTATMKCAAEGIPQPNITWMKNGVQLQELSFLEMRPDDGVLLISGTQDLDAGDYDCVATNEAGTATGTISLQVGTAVVIVQRPQSRGVEIAKNATLRCSAVGNPAPTITWKGPDGKDIGSENPRILIQDNGDLFINGVEREDEGAYVCVARNQLGHQQVSAFISVTGIVKPVIDFTDHNVDAVVTKDVRLSCVVIGGNPIPKVTWSKLGEPISAGEGVIIDDVNGYLLLKKVKVIDGGEYTCVAENIAGNASLIVKLNVQVPPSINETVAEYFVREGHSVQLSCQATGNPKPEITWSKNGVKISDSDLHYLVDETGTLEIFSAVTADSAVYQCAAANVAGSREHRTSLFVQTPPTIDEEFEDLKVIVNTPVQLSCQVTGQPPPTVSWTKSGQPINHHGNDSRLELLSNGALRIVSASVEDSGLYECFASNPAGNASKLITVSIQVPPRLLNREPGTMTFIAGQQVVLPCDVIGEPKPVLTWKKNFQVLGAVSADGKYHVHDNGSLVIPSVYVSDAARFLCVAENSAGIEVQEIQLTVHELPYFSTELPGEATVLANERVVLECPARGTPFPQITWYKDGSALTGNELSVRILGDGSLSLDAVQIEDRAKYSCVAENLAGNISRVIELRVYLTPRFENDELRSDIENAQEVIRGQPIRIQCQATSFPPPVITWHKDGIELTEEDFGGRMVLHEDGKELEIRAAEEEDAGRYKCIANNVAGLAEKITDVDVWVAPEIDETIASDRNLSVIVTRPFFISCPVVGGVPQPEVTWFKDDRPIGRGQDKGIKVVSSGQRLEFDAVDITDAGKYICEARNRAGFVEREHNVTVLVPPKINGSDSMTSTEVLVNSSTILRCAISGFPYPEVTWYHGDDVIDGNTSGVHVMAGDLGLHIPRVQLSHNGTYTCRATNEAGETSKQDTLTVLVVPEIMKTQVEQNPSVVLNETAVISCPSSGIPFPDVVWMRNEDRIDDSRYPNVELREENRQLVIKNVGTVDSATYRCLVMNKVGQDSLDFVLEVVVPANIDRLGHDLYPSVRINQTRSLLCPVFGIPTPEVIWYKDGDLLSPNTNQYIYTQDEGRRLEVTATSTFDSGVYQCRVHNDAGEDQLTYHLKVIVPPEIDAERSSPRNPKVMVNETGVIVCLAKGIPPPTISWRVNGQPLDRTDQRYSLSRDGSRLQVYGAQVTDAGRYTCVAKNDAGFAENDFDLEVLVPPYSKTAESERHVTVVKGKTTVLDCPIQGIPFPNVTWTRDGEPLTPDIRMTLLYGGRHLELSMVAESDAAKYKCTGSNEAGKTTLSFNVTVVVPPELDEANVVDNPRIIANRTMLLECPVGGVPPPKVTWLKNGEALVPRPGIRFLSNGRQVEIFRTQVTDAARYTCVAKNEAGELRKNYDLEVLVLPTIDGAGKTDLVEAIEGSTVYLPCSTSGHPEPSVTWLKDGVRLVDDGSHSNKRELSGGRQLELRQVTSADEGLYRCQAVNIAGQKLKNYRIRVVRPPKISDSAWETSLSVVERHSFRLECNASGSPEPRLSWQKDGGALSSAANRRILHNGRLLQVTNANADDAGRFVCNASNVAGHRQKTYRVRVLVVPRLNGSQEAVETVTVAVGGSVVLDCSVIEGFPDPVVRWHRNGFPLSLQAEPNVRTEEAEGGGQRLIVFGVQLMDAGVYSCMVANEAGNASKDFLLNVLVPPSIEASPEDVAAVVGSRVALHCDSSGIPKPEVKWEKNGVAISDRNHVLTHSGSLVFAAVKMEDGGDYRCTASNEAGSVSRNVSLSVQVMPIIEEDAALVKVTIGNPVEIPCSASGVPPPRITWLKGTRVLLDVPGYSISENGSLLMSSAEHRHAGVYACIARNNAGTDIKQRRLEVQVPPMIDRHQSSSYVVTEEREMLLTCRVSGIPPPVVRWIRDNQTIAADDPHYRLIHSNALAIPIVRAEDSGIFTCFAENEAGESSVDFHLEVQVPPTIEDHDHVVTVNESDRATLPCVASGFPRPQLMWIQGGRTMLVSGGRFSIGQTGNLTIEDVKTTDAGSYVCSAKNVAGRVSKEFSLRVQVAPQMTRLPTEQTVNVSAPIDLECAADGVPTPTIKWRFNNTQLSPQPLSINGHSRLVIGNALKHDAGTYMCIAENSAGTARALAAVLVRVPPKIQMLDDVQSVSRSGRVVLDCPVVGGDPPPSVLWTKHGREISLGERIHQLSNGSLVIYDVTSEDGGDYRCVATNEAGFSEGVAHVTVETPPVFLVRPESQTVEQGQTVTMHCSATGEPEPAIAWNKEGVALQTGERFAILANNSLRIVAAQMNDSGVYKCIARNFEGKLVSAELTVQVNGLWSSWSSWSQCSVSCGLGTRDRRRRCNHPEPMNGGKNCSGPDSETKSCRPIDCPVDGGWSEWSPWNDCSRSCGQGQMSRSRECNNPLPVHGGRYCYGESMQTNSCRLRPCPIDGNWGGWSSWKPCSEKCGAGIQERFRRCNSPQPDNGGNGCLGNDSERRPCHVTDCEVHGSWGPWSDWSQCAVSCGGGETARRRLCDSPSPANGGRFCLGQDSQTQSCNNDECPVQSEWMDWMEWGHCTVSCGGGQRRRFRVCTDPTSNRIGRQCIGSGQETESCNINSCSVDGTWNSWGQWSDCSKSCGSGAQQRQRTCHGPKFGGNTCPGNAMETRNCNSYPCQAAFPRYSVTNVFGNINNVDLGLSRLFTTINRTNRGSVVSATVTNVTSVTSSHFEQLVSLMNPVHWTAASEMDDAINGYSLTKGSFRTETHFEFASGQTLQMVHQSRGLDNDGVLQVDTFANGEIPDVAGVNVIQKPFEEDYIQTGPGNIYGQSSRVFLVNGHNLPYASNHSISYNPEFGSMPYLVQRMKVTDIQMTLNISQKVLTYQATTAMAKGEPSNSCPPGFGLNPKDPFCEDVDECSQLSPCSHICQNTAGSFKCSCPVGLSLFSDGRTCRDVNECEARDAQCPLSLDCVNTVGSFRCLAKCESGHRRSVISLLCDDVNECSENVALCHHECINVPGSYICACKQGFRLIGRSRCEDIDECKEGTHRCSDICRNTLGGYQCDCPFGYALDGQFTCVDVDECAGRVFDCAPGLKCRNLDGGYECISSCPSGFKQLTNGSCIDVDECAGNGFQCRYNQLCVNTIGSYSCGCPRGFRTGGPNMPCIDIDECQSQVLCQHKCSNTVGSFQCSCPRGYRLTGNGRTCEDIDECSESANDCGLDKKCFNRRGDFECVDISCPDGYERDSDDESGSRTACRATNDKDALEFHLIALPSGIRAHQDLIRLLVYNQNNVHVMQSTFSLMNDLDHPPFTIRLEDGKGIIQTLKPLEDRASYHLKVEGKSYDHYGHNVLYHTTFVVYISVSSYPY